MTVCQDVTYVGVNDHQIDLFEGQFAVPHGMSYNSYLIQDEKVCVMDSVDEHFGGEWLLNIQNELGDRQPDYLLVQHMEMDHSANIIKFAENYPEAKIVASKMAFTMMKNMFGSDFADRQIVVTEGSTLELGKHTLKFITAPNVHWPEVIMTYDVQDKILFSADAFGKFGALDYEDPQGWEEEARPYYFGIVGKFGAPVQALLKKAAALEINCICPLHGPVLKENISHYVNLYNTWSSYDAESDGVLIAYTSVYGHTKSAALRLAEILKDKGCKNVALADLARDDFYRAVSDAFRYSKLVLASTTYNGGVFPAMRKFILSLTDRNFQKRKVAFIENSSWAPAAAKTMASLLESCSELNYCETKVSVKISLKDSDEEALAKLADELL
ncbi:flavodoxin domain-containing protein [Treponema sp.]|uniref:FprA family A-type flavoprotein n=1 Tax=Treponema sp. TaxID=166 RepID=UPI0025F2E269|nr:flavodoxin domain-containing protein [Treponema sp.]MCR5218403.1 MBL fold metallo-hydrolase [Treponema sp.]